MNPPIHPQPATLRLLAAALELQHLTGTAANVVPIPGGDRVIAIGTRADVARVLRGAPVTPSDLMTVECPACDGSVGCDECSGHGQIIVSRADMTAAHADHADSEGGHHD